MVKTEADVGKYTALVAAGPLIGNISAYTQLKGIIKRPKVSWKRIEHHFKGSFYLFLPQIATLLYLQMDKAMIEGMTGATSQVSFYDQAEKLVTVALSCITALSTVMMPRIANEYKKGNDEKIIVYINKTAKFSLAMAAPLTVGLMCIATRMIPWYLGDEFMPTAYAIIAISPITISNALMGISGKQYFIATNRIKIITIANFSAAGVNLLTNALLIPQYGYMGAAIATLIASYTNVLIQFIYLNKYMQINKVLHGSLRYVLLSVVMGGVIVCETRILNLQASIITTFVQVFSGILIYCGALTICKDEVAVFAIDSLMTIYRRRKKA